MPSDTVRIGVIRTPSARWQAEFVRGILAAEGLEAELVDVPPDEGAGALLGLVVSGTVHGAVHAMEDLPLDLPGGVELAAVGPRDDARDGLVAREPVDWLELPYGATVAARGVRRRGQLLAARPDLRVVALHGPLSDSLARLEATSEWSALVVTVANMVRLGLADRIADRLDPMLLVPAPGQGAIGVTAAATPSALLPALWRGMHDPATATAVSAERAFARALGAAPDLPIAAHAVRDDTSGRLRLHGRVVSPEGDVVAEVVRLAPVADGDERAACAFGEAAAAEARLRGADAILAALTLRS